jgi:hypothetical protein
MTAEALGPQKPPIARDSERDQRERMLDKTIADSFPASDPPSTDPAPYPDDLDVENPSADDPQAA